MTHIVMGGFEFLHSLGHSRPIQSVPVPINVRCYSDSDMIVRRSKVTLRATSRLGRYRKNCIFDHLELIVLEILYRNHSRGHLFTRRIGSLGGIP